MGSEESTTTEQGVNAAATVSKPDSVGSEDMYKKAPSFWTRVDVRICMCNMSLNPSLYFHI